MARAGGAARLAWTPGAGSSCVASNCMKTIAPAATATPGHWDERGASGVSTRSFDSVLEIR